MALKPVDLEQAGVWQALFVPALSLMEHLESRIEGATWTFGGGTVLMLRIAHRFSKDVDFFVPDPQYLGYVNPRLTDEAAEVSEEYDESAEHIKLHLEAGEIDIVAGGSLTSSPFENVPYRGRVVRVETSAEIIAKKMWHRGDRAKARDLFDLCAVAESEPSALEVARPFFARHGAQFIAMLQDRAEVAIAEYAAIDAISTRRDFASDLALAKSLIEPVLV